MLKIAILHHVISKKVGAYGIGGDFDRAVGYDDNDDDDDDDNDKEGGGDGMLCPQYCQSTLFYKFK